MKTLQNLQNGNKQTQAKVFIFIAVVIVIAGIVLNHFGVVNFDALNR